MTKSDLWKKELMSGLWSRGIRFHHGGEGMAVSIWSKMLRDHIFNHMQEAQRANWKCGKATVTSKPTPVTILPPPSLLTLKVPPVQWPHQLGTSIQTPELRGNIAHSSHLSATGKAATHLLSSSIQATKLPRAIPCPHSVRLSGTSSDCVSGDCS